MTDSYSIRTVHTSTGTQLSEEPMSTDFFLVWWLRPSLSAQREFEI